MMMALQARDCSKVTAFRKERERKQETKKAERERKQKKKTRSCHAAHRRWTRGRGRMVVLSACLTSKAGKPLVARQVLAFGVRACEPFRACVRARQRWWQPERASGDRTCQCRCRARDCTGAEVAPATFALVRCNSGRHCFGCCCCCCCCCCSLMGEWDPGQWPACFIPRILTLQPLSLWR